MVFIETATFTSQITKLASDEEQREFQNVLVANPDAGDLIRGGGGIRKVRMAIRGRGKSGGARVIYFWRRAHDQIYLLVAYAKAAKTDLSPREQVILRDIVKDL